MEIKSELPELEVRRVANKRFSKRESQKLCSFRNCENPKKTLNDKKEKKICTKCGRDRSHLTCPAAEKECFNCCKVGHFSAQCFLRKWDNGNKQVKPEKRDHLNRYYKRQWEATVLSHHLHCLKSTFTATVSIQPYKNSLWIRIIPETLKQIWRNAMILIGLFSQTSCTM